MRPLLALLLVVAFAGVTSAQCRSCVQRYVMVPVVQVNSDVQVEQKAEAQPQARDAHVVVQHPVYHVVYRRPRCGLFRWRGYRSYGCY